MDDSRAGIYGGDMDYAIDSIQWDNGGSYLYQESSIYNEPRICSACGGSGLSEFRCTWCDGDGIDPAYEATEGSVLHSFAQRNCAKCSGSGYSSCFYCGGDGIK